MRQIGPCYTCSQWGHLARACPRNQQPYPFGQSVLSVSGMSCVSNSEPNKCIDQNAGGAVAVHQSQGEGLKVDSNGQMGASSNVKGQMEGVDETAQQLVKESVNGTAQHLLKSSDCETSQQLFKDGVDSHGCASLLPAGEPVNSFGLGPSNLDNDWELARSWECEEQGTTAHQIVDVQGRLRQCLRFWSETLKAPPPVDDWIQSGYRLPLQYLPTPFEQGNHRSTLDHLDFASESVQELVNNRCVREVPEKPMVCSPLSVVLNQEGKCRLVLNLRHLNQFLRKDHFKYEDLRVAMLMVEQTDLLLKFDLKSGYHHMDIFEPHQAYLGFA